MKVVVTSVLVLLAMVQMLVKPGESLTCGQVDASLASCISYPTAGGTPAAACCDGVKNLKTITPTTADRRAACDCVKAAAARYLNIKEDAVGKSASQLSSSLLNSSPESQQSVNVNYRSDNTSSTKSALVMQTSADLVATVLHNNYSDGVCVV